MQMECPKCGCKLSAFDCEETEACPDCGLRLSTRAVTTVSVSASSPEHQNSERFEREAAACTEDHPSPVLRNSEPFKVSGLVWVIHLACPGTIVLLAALIGTASNGFHALRMGVFAGVAIALGTSLLLSLRYQGWLARLGMTFLLFATSVVVNGFVLFGGCMLMIGISSHK